jgi:hypothetical protein
MPPAPSDDRDLSKPEGVPSGYVNIHTLLPSAQFFNLHPYAKDRMCDNDFIPDLLTCDDPSAG